MAKIKLQDKFDKLKTDEARVKFLMKHLEADDWSDSIWPEYGGKYMLGSVWDPVIFSKKLFKQIEPKLEKQAERETDGVHYYWVLKGKY